MFCLNNDDEFENHFSSNSLAMYFDPKSGETFLLTEVEYGDEPFDDDDGEEF